MDRLEINGGQRCVDDRTGDIIEDWTTRDPRIKALHLPTNRKLPAALNAGFALARGRFHTWTSDDNWYDPLL